MSNSENTNEETVTLIQELEELQRRLLLLKTRFNVLVNKEYERLSRSSPTPKEQTQVPYLRLVSKK